MKLYQHQTEKAVENFPVVARTVSLDLIYAIVQVKKAAVIANYKSKNIDKDISEAIIYASDEILSGRYEDQFVTAAIQGGAGTSINMNINEVIASIASKKIGKEVHPNDHVNRSQSTNDVNPTGLKVAILSKYKNLIKHISKLEKAFRQKGEEYKKVIKLGRTHVQDAVPITFQSEFDSYAEIIARDKERIEEIEKYFFDVNIGGTAVGNSINATDEYNNEIISSIREVIDDPRIRHAKNKMSQTSSGADTLHLASLIKILFADLSKIAVDLRVLSSGPRGGIGEIELEALQPGSSIMPGKVNPVIPEYINQAYYYISGKVLSIEHAVEGASLELGIMFPVMADSILSILDVAIITSETFAEKCISKIKLNQENTKKNLEASTAFATLLTPKYGYDKISKYVKESIKSGKSFKKIFMENENITEEDFDKLITI